MGIFDSMQIGQESSPIDALMELLNKENIELKTDLNITQIKILFQLHFFTNLKKTGNKEKDPYQIFWESIEYFLCLMTSLKRERAKEIIKGLTEMKESYYEQMNLLKNLGKK